MKTERTDLKCYVLLAFVFQAYAKDDMDELADQLVTKLVDRAHSLWSEEDLDDTTLGKPGTAMSQLSFAPPQFTHSRHIAQAQPGAAAPLDQNWKEQLDVIIPWKKSANSAFDSDRYASWAKAYKSLLKNELQGVSGDEAMQMVHDEGAVIVDVRPEAKFQEESIEGAVNVPLYVTTEATSVFNMAKIAATAIGGGVQATHRNPDFETIAQSKLPHDKPIIILDNRGGTLDDISKSQPGALEENIDNILRNDLTRYTTGLKAASVLYRSGYQDLYFVTGGLDHVKDQLQLVPGGKSSPM